MFESITIALVKTLASYIFGGYLKAHYGSVEIEGAPSWYGKEPYEAICVSTYNYGGLDKLEITKKESKIKLDKRVKDIIKSVIYQNFKNLKPDEEKFLESIQKDKNLPLFVATNIKFQNIKVDKDKKMVFIRSCLNKKAFINYEKNKIKELKKEVIFYKSDKAFKELDDKKHIKSGRDDKAFEELDEIN
jgi:hypothetical protein